MRVDRDYILDIANAISRIEKHSGKGRKAYDEIEEIQVWMAYYLQIIGEAASHLSDNLKRKHSDIPWEDIIGMRVILVHKYFAVDYDIVWDAVVNDVPILKEIVTGYLKENPSS